MHIRRRKDVSNMGKLLILSVTDHEEHILNKIMETIANEPELNHIAPPLPCNILSFTNLEIRLKEQTVSCSGQLVTLPHGLVILAGYSQPARFMRPYGIETVNAAAPPLPVSSVRSGASWRQIHQRVAISGLYWAVDINLNPWYRKRRTYADWLCPALRFFETRLQVLLPVLLEKTYINSTNGSLLFPK
mgnify:CR=1 FL=1